MTRFVNDTGHCFWLSVLMSVFLDATKIYPSYSTVAQAKSLKEMNVQKLWFDATNCNAT